MDKVIIATGARPNLPAIEGIDRIDYLTNEEALKLRELPRSLCVIGGRALGLEFAQMYAQFGTRVVLLQRGERILPEHEPEIADELTKNLFRLVIGHELHDAPGVPNHVSLGHEIKRQNPTRALHPFSVRLSFC